MILECRCYFLFHIRTTSLIFPGLFTVGEDVFYRQVLACQWYTYTIIISLISVHHTICRYREVRGRHQAARAHIMFCMRVVHNNNINKYCTHESCTLDNNVCDNRMNPTAAPRRSEYPLLHFHAVNNFSYRRRRFWWDWASVSKRLGRLVRPSVFASRRHPTLK